MKVVCGWCGVLIKPGEPSPVSHGICPNCETAFLEARGSVTLKEYIERFAFPIVVVNSNVELIEANPGAVRFVGKDVAQIEGKLGGDVIECVHASQAHGCGRTVHCKACTIRNSVTRTYQTGVPVIDALAYQEIATKNGPEKIRLKVSTVKVSDSVLLKMVPA